MNILTFDIEEWFHILDNKSTQYTAQWRSFDCRIHANAYRILDLLSSRNQKATLFCLGWVAQRYPEILREAVALNLEIGSHTYSHQLAFRQSPREFEADLRKSIDIIQGVTGKRVTSFRIPGFSLVESSAWVFDVLARCGIEADSSIFPARRNHGGFRDFGSSHPALVQTKWGTLQEFPINTHSVLGVPVVFSGGGYFRLTPYRVIRHFIRKSGYVMTYFHPRDFDCRQPMIPSLSAFRRILSYYGVCSAFAKFERMLDEFSFVDLATARQAVDWSSVRQVSF